MTVRPRPAASRPPSAADTIGSSSNRDLLMKNDRSLLAFLVTSALLCATAAAADPSDDAKANMTNRISLSLRFGLGISARFKGIGGSLQSSAAPANGRKTPDGDRYNYDDGYVLTDASGNAGNQTCIGVMTTPARFRAITFCSTAAPRPDFRPAARRGASRISARNWPTTGSWGSRKTGITCVTAWKA